jgi:hypothetical protein
LSAPLREQWNGLSLDKKVAVVLAVPGAILAVIGISAAFGIGRGGGERAATAPPPVTLDQMRTAFGWLRYRDKEGSTLQLALSGRDDQPFAIKFSLVADGYVGITKGLPAGALAGTRAVRFRYAGRGASNTLEFKLLYGRGADGSRPIFSKGANGVTDTRGAWRTVTIPYSDLACWPTTGCRDGEPIDPARVELLDFAISNKSGEVDVPGRGSVSIADVVALR